MGGIGDVAHRSIMRIKLRLILLAFSAYSSIASATPALALAHATPLAIAQQREAATGGGLYDPTGASADFAVPRDTRPR